MLCPGRMPISARRGSGLPSRVRPECRAGSGALSSPLTVSLTLRDTARCSFLFKCHVFLVVNSYLPEYSLCSSHTLEPALKNRSVRMASTPPPMYRFYSTATKAVLLQLKQFLTKIQYLICGFYIIE